MLRRNPLVRGITEMDAADDEAIAYGVRRRVLRLLDDAVERAPLRVRARAERQRSIVLRYDIGGEPRERVASALGISPRQLYRERREIFARLAEGFSPVVRFPGPAQTVVAAEPFQVAFAIASQLAAAGQVELAIAQLVRLAGGTEKAEHRFCALLAAARECFDVEDLDRARALVKACKPLVTEDVSALYDLLTARLCWFDGDYPQMVRLRDRAFARSAKPADPASRPHAIAGELLVSEAINFAAWAQCIGDTERSTRLFAQAQSLMNVLTVVPLYLSTLWRLSFAQAQVLASGASEPLAAEIRCVMALAELNGYPGLASNAAMVASCLAEARRDLGAAAELQSAAIAFSEMLDTPYFAAVAKCRAAVLSHRLGSERRALELADEAVDRLRGRSVAFAYAQVKHGWTNFRAGLVETARDDAADVLSMGDVLSKTPARLGSALRLAGLCSLSGGDTKRATRYIADAIDVLRTSGPREELLESCRTLQRITGKAIAITAK